MPGLIPGGGVSTPFGRREYLRSAKGKRTNPYMIWKGSVPPRTIDGVAGQKILQMGTAIAKITSGPGAGLFGPFNAGASNGLQTLANLVGLCDTFLPWQLMERDCEVAVTYECAAVQAWCFEYTSTADEAVPIALTNTTAAALQRGGAAGKIADITWQ